MRADSTITDSTATVISSTCLGGDISLVRLHCPDIAAEARPGNFVNIRVSPSGQPLLRRPFSIHDVEGDTIDIMAKSIGPGSTLLCTTPAGTRLQTLGPLGNAFDIDTPAFETALLVSGGIGTAPMLFLQKALLSAGKRVVNFIGGRTKADIRTEGLTNCRIATDDGSAGFGGTVVDLLEESLPSIAEPGTLKVFSCGPNPMLEALAALCGKTGLPCEASLETVMGCGIGICYGCSVELRDESGKGTSTILLCQEGPVVDAGRLVF